MLLLLLRVLCLCLSRSSSTLSSSSLLGLFLSRLLFRSDLSFSFLARFFSFSFLLLFLRSSSSDESVEGVSERSRRRLLRDL